MAIAIDGFAILQRVGKNANAFAAVRAEVDKQARAVVVKCLKAKSVGLAAIREIHKALGNEQIELLIEGLKDVEVKSILTRLDKHHPDLKSGTANWRRQHLNVLANGATEPRSPPEKLAKKAASPKSIGKKAPIKKAKLGSETMDVFAKKKG